MEHRLLRSKKNLKRSKGGGALNVPVGSLVVIKSITNNSITNPYLFRVVKETDKGVEISRIDENGEFVNAEKTKPIRKTSILKVLDRIENFAPFKKMNDDLNEKWTAYLSVKFECAKELEKILNQK